MKNKLQKKVFVATLIVMLAATACVFLLQTQEFIYYYREQHLLFPTDAGSIKQLLAQQGGLAQLASRLLVQCFTTPWAGPLLSCLCAVTSALLLWMGLRRVGQPKCLLALCFVPGVIQLVVLADVSAYYTNLTSLLLASLLLNAATWCFRFGKIAGCTGIAVALAAFICCGYAPDAYYDPRLPLPLYCAYPAMAMAGCMIVASISRHLPTIKGEWWAWLINGTMVIALLLGAARVSKGLIKTDSYKFYELNNYAIKGEWDKLLEACRQTSLSNTLYMNYLNLALSHRGELLEQMFRYPQKGPSSIICDYQSIPDILQLQSMVLLRMGNVAGAQNRAFSANVCNQMGSPSAVQTLVITNLAMGFYEVAEKYIVLLEKTRNYRAWAQKQRAFLYNDDAIEADETLGRLRKGLTIKDHFALSHGYLNDQDLILEANGGDVAARDYLIAMALLAKDKESISYISEKYLNSTTLPNVPRVLQEGIYSLAENDPEFLASHGVSEETSHRYSDFVNKVVNCRKTGKNAAAELRREYGNSFWYYLMFN